MKVPRHFNHFLTATTTTPVRQSIRSSSILPKNALSVLSTQQQQRRHFLPPPWAAAEPQTLTATRTLPHAASSLYKIISDVASYSAFVPYCQSSTVTRWSAPDAQGRRWASEADLSVGWGGVQEKFTSRVFCAPERVVEAVSGEAKPSLKEHEIPHHYADAAVAEEAGTERVKDRASSPAAGAAGARSSGGLGALFGSSSSSSSSNTQIFTYLLTRWEVRPFPYKPPATSPNVVEGSASAPAREQTEVNLVVEFQFANPLYAAMSRAVAPKVAGLMIDAFEKRAEALLGRPASGAGRGLGGSAKTPGTMERIVGGRGHTDEP
ncbi:MAG: hypothetical protein M1819_006324 [Sarea resinae]|nr:MAG: hypothetical protein M1819_006324 [Sarea resinae]